MVHGGAGSGKSKVIKTTAQWPERIFRKEGDDPNCPYILVTATTGTAAANIDGINLHSAFGFTFGNEYFSLNDKTRDKKIAELKNLQIIIIDKISMVKADMLYQLHLRLQEIKNTYADYFGGVAVFCFGDLMQLPPVQAK